MLQQTNLRYARQPRNLSWHARPNAVIRLEQTCSEMDVARQTIHDNTVNQHLNKWNAASTSIQNIMEIISTQNIHTSYSNKVYSLSKPSFNTSITSMSLPVGVISAISRFVIPTLPQVCDRNVIHKETPDMNQTSLTELWLTSHVDIHEKNSVKVVLAVYRLPY